MTTTVSRRSCRTRLESEQCLSGLRWATGGRYFYSQSFSTFSMAWLSTRMPSGSQRKKSSRLIVCGRQTSFRVPGATSAARAPELSSTFHTMFGIIKGQSIPERWIWPSHNEVRERGAIVYRLQLHSFRPRTFGFRKIVSMKQA